MLFSLTMNLCCDCFMFHVWQDPVYRKGKLGEIQGLVLGMLDTFNYEQVTPCGVWLMGQI